MLKNSKTTEVFCTLQVEGTHYWEDCPFEEVAYLREEHRHIFHITASAPVNHNDRDVEFIMMKHKIQNFLKAKYVSMDDVQQLHNFGSMSCEHIASEILDTFDLARVVVSEDAENGAVVYTSNQPN
jgi:hypothetical protein